VSAGDFVVAEKHEQHQSLIADALFVGGVLRIISDTPLDPDGCKFFRIDAFIHDKPQQRCLDIQDHAFFTDIQIALFSIMV